MHTDPASKQLRVSKKMPKHVYCGAEAVLDRGQLFREGYSVDDSMITAGKAKGVQIDLLLTAV